VVVKAQEVLKPEIRILLSTCLSRIITIIYCYLRNKADVSGSVLLKYLKPAKHLRGVLYKTSSAYRADDKVRAYIKIENLNDEEFINNNYIIFCTKQGMIKKPSLKHFLAHELMVSMRLLSMKVIQLTGSKTDF
jgi:hypothetical protein